MLKQLGKSVLKFHDWSIADNIPPETSRCVLVAGPHTSNWDFYFAVSAMHALGVPIKVAIKNFWTKFPMNSIIVPLGGIGLDPNAGKKFDRKANQTTMLANVFKEYEDIALIISPEGNRVKTDKWKTGFFRIAEMANVPIALAYLDYKKKIAGIGPVLSADTGLDVVMSDLMKFYSSITPKFPDQFVIDRRYKHALI